jgi:hypothetical protein
VVQRNADIALMVYAHYLVSTIVSLSCLLFFPREMEDGPDAVFLFRLSCLHIMSHGRRRISNPEKRYQSSSDVVVSVQMAGASSKLPYLHVLYVVCTSTNVHNNRYIYFPIVFA